MKTYQVSDRLQICLRRGDIVTYRGDALVTSGTPRLTAVLSSFSQGRKLHRDLPVLIARETPLSSSKPAEPQGLIGRLGWDHLCADCSVLVCLTANQGLLGGGGCDGGVG